MKMKAVVVRETGGPEVLKIEDLPIPAPGDDQVLVKVHACGICRHDILVREGILKGKVSYPLVLGHEISGEVIENGKHAKKFKSGDRVICIPWSHLCGKCKYCRTGRNAYCPEGVFMGDTGLNGGYAEYVVIDEYNLVSLPDQISAEKASFIACSMTTAFNAVVITGKVAPNDTVLVTGASGGVGIHAIQFAKLSGGKVIAQAIESYAVDILYKYGADEVVITKPGEDFTSRIKDLTEGYGVDVVIDSVGTPTFKSALGSLVPYGRWVFFGQITGDFIQFSPAQIFLKGLTILSTLGFSKEHFESVVRLVGEGKVEPVLAKTFPLKEVAKAHMAFQSNKVIGKTVLTISK